MATGEMRVIPEGPTRRLEVRGYEAGRPRAELRGESGQYREFVDLRPSVLKEILDTLRAWGRLVEPSESEE